MVNEVIDEILLVEEQAREIIEQAKIEAQELIAKNDILLLKLAQDSDRSIKTEAERIIADAQSAADALLCKAAKKSETACAEINKASQDKIAVIVNDLVKEIIQSKA